MNGYITYKVCVEKGRMCIILKRSPEFSLYYRAAQTQKSKI